MGEITEEGQNKIVEKLDMMEELRIKVSHPEEKAQMEGWIEALTWVLKEV